MVNAIVVRRTLGLVIDVNCDAWRAAKELEAAVLEVDTVLGRTNVVMGTCVDMHRTMIEACGCVVNCEEDDG